MSVELDRLAVYDDKPRLTLPERLGIGIVIVLVGAACVSVFYLWELEKAKYVLRAEQDMRVLEDAFRAPMTSNGNREPNYPADIIPLLKNGEAATIDQWGGQYQMRIIQTEVGPRPQFFTFAPDGMEIVWPKQ